MFHAMPRSSVRVALLKGTLKNDRTALLAFENGCTARYPASPCPGCPSAVAEFPTFVELPILQGIIRYVDSGPRPRTYTLIHATTGRPQAGRTAIVVRRVDDLALMALALARTDPRTSTNRGLEMVCPAERAHLLWEFHDRFSIAPRLLQRFLVVSKAPWFVLDSARLHRPAVRVIPPAQAERAMPGLPPGMV